MYWRVKVEFYHTYDPTEPRGEGHITLAYITYIVKGPNDEAKIRDKVDYDCLSDASADMMERCHIVECEPTKKPVKNAPRRIVEEVGESLIEVRQRKWDNPEDQWEYFGL